MSELVGLAQLIIEEFEKEVPTAITTDNYDDNAESIALYLAAKKYNERHG